MQELEFKRRDALIYAFYARYMADPDDVAEINASTAVIQRIAAKLPTETVEECRQLAEEMADMEHFWEER